MQKCVLRCASILLLVVLPTSAVSAQNSVDPDGESKLIALERVAKQQAWAAKDLKTLDRILDDAFVYVSPDGRLLTKTDVLAYVQTADSFQYLMEAMMVRFHGDTAIVTGLYRMKTVERGRPLVGRGRFVDTWRQIEGRWVAIASLSTPGG